MNFLDVQTFSLRNIGIYDDIKKTSSNSRVTIFGIQDIINQLYINQVITALSNSFSRDFEQITAPIPMYLNNLGTVAASTVTTTLNTLSNIFDNTMINVKIQNSITLATATILKYNNQTQVITDGDVSSWIGQTFYILHNEYPLSEDITDLREITGIATKYTASNTQYIPAEQIRKRDFYFQDVGHFMSTEPKFYQTTIKVDGVHKKGFGIVPRPYDYTGSYQLIYQFTVPKMQANTDIPMLDNIGVGQVLVDGASAWGQMILGDFERAAYFEKQYQGENSPKCKYGITGLINNYKPIGRSQPTRPREGKQNYNTRLRYN